MQKVLVIDDDRDMCILLHRFLKRRGYEVFDFTSVKKAYEWLAGDKPDIVLCDLKLENISGLQVMQELHEKHPALPFIIMTGYSDVKSAVEIMKQGAYDYVTKPLFPDEILITIQKALENKEDEKNVFSQKKPVAEENGTETSEEVPRNNYSFSDEYIFGNSLPFRQIVQQISLVAPTNYSVIIYGESGSGKEAIAHEIHKKSPRAKFPFVAIDCGALSKELALSEMYGHEKGSFTGALNQKTGSFEVANGGTIFLDEVGNLPYDIQVSLLRVIQERKIRRVGGTKDIDLDVRIIVASNERLWDAAHKGKFREDLYHRFNEFSINLPPLRERKEDIMIFAHHFLRLTNTELGKNVKGFSQEAENIFKNYVWYGNLRELKNVIKRATLLTDGEKIEPTSLPFEITNFQKLNPLGNLDDDNKNVESPLRDMANEGAPFHIQEKDLNLKSASIDAEYETILAALKKVNFNKSKAAKMLNIDRKTLYNKIKEYESMNTK